MPAWRRVGDSDLPELVPDEPAPPAQQEPGLGPDPGPEPKAARKRKPAASKPRAKKG
jgi:hypothetical protein